MPRAICGQTPSVLHIKVVVVDATRKATPVPRHALLVSDNPSTAPPRRVVTTLDGTADLRLPPGNYTVESERPVTFDGKAYQWTQIVDIRSGQDLLVELTTENAEVVPVPAATTAAPPSSAAATTVASVEVDPSVLLSRWQDSVIAVWTPTAHASGFVFDSRGLIATNQRAVGTATSVEVQLTPTVKIPASVLGTDPTRDVAILWVDPHAVTSLQPVPLGCQGAEAPSIVKGQKVFTIVSPFNQPKDMTSGALKQVEAQVMADFVLARGTEGGPAFTAEGGVVGFTTAVRDDTGERRHEDIRIVRSKEACDVVASAQKRMTNAAPPMATHLPVEPSWMSPLDALKDAAKRRVGSLSPYMAPSSSFDVAFITPIQIVGAQYQSGPASRERPFGNWSEYVESVPPVLLVRVTPKMVGGFWTTVARGAAQTQGVSLPSITHVKSGFSRLRARCADGEVTAIHSFRVERRLSEREAVSEGLYAFDPRAFGPQCGTLTLILYAEKEPEKGDARVVDPRIVEQVWQDFAPYRALNP